MLLFQKENPQMGNEGFTFPFPKEGYTSTELPLLQVRYQQVPTGNRSVKGFSGLHVLGFDRADLKVHTVYQVAQKGLGSPRDQMHKCLQQKLWILTSVQ